MKRIDLTMLFMTALAGAAAFFAGELILSAGADTLSFVLLMGIYFACAGLIIAAITHIGAYKIGGIRSFIPVPGVFLKTFWIFIAAAAAGAFLAGCLFQYIYGLDIGGYRPVNDYFIAIDNSGSMQQNDPDFKRYDSLKEIYGFIKKNQTLSVYTFTDDYRQVFASKHITPGDIANFDNDMLEYKVSDGNTDLTPVLGAIADSIKAGNLNGSSGVIIISDGDCDVNQPLINRFVDMEVPINAIGVRILGYAESLRRITETTGGIYVDTDDTARLAEIAESIYNRNSGRHLAGYRGGKAEKSAVYAIMRIVFLFMLGMLFRLAQILSMDIKDVRRQTLPQGVFLCLAGAMLAELLLQRAGANEAAARAVLMLCFALLLVFLPNSVSILHLDEISPRVRAGEKKHNVLRP